MLFHGVIHKETIYIARKPIAIIPETIRHCCANAAIISVVISTILKHIHKNSIHVIHHLFNDSCILYEHKKKKEIYSYT